MCSLSLKPYFQEIHQHSTYQELPAQSFQQKKSALNNKNSIYLPHQLCLFSSNFNAFFVCKIIIFLVIDGQFKKNTFLFRKGP
jgi:hypothetical protein